MDHRNELSLAWELFDAIRPELAVNDVTRFSVQLSTADAITTIGQLLDYCVQAGLGVPPRTADRLCRWLECYVGHDAEDGLGSLVSRLIVEPAGIPRSVPGVRRLSAVEVGRGVGGAVPHLDACRTSISQPSARCAT